jgi:HEAT repeat protein
MLRWCACLGIALAAAVALAQSDSGGNPALNAAFESLGKLELGQDLGAFQPIRQAVVAARSDESIRADLETRLIAVLQGDATDLAKDYACRQLELVGSDASLPALAALLTNARMSHGARCALEGIRSPSAMKTLRDMLGKTEGRQQIGVVISLGRLADAEAVAPIAALLGQGNIGQENKELGEACLVALGRIGTRSAAEALRAFAPTAPETLRAAVVDAQLDAAKALCRQGEHQAAAEICETLLSCEPQRTKAAAFRGLIAAKPAESLSMIVAGLAADEPWKRAVAADCVVALDKPQQIQFVAAAIADLPTPGKIAALVSLQGRCDPAIRAAALTALSLPDVDVRKAALAALIRSATVDDVPMLAALLTSEEEQAVRDAACETLSLMPVDGVSEALAAWMGQANELAPITVQCALARRSPKLVPALLLAARSANGATRLDAIKALEIMAGETDVEALVELLGQTPADAEREAADRAVWKCCQKIADPARRSAPLLAAMEKGDANAQCAILPTLARVGGAEVLPAVRRAMQSADTAVRDAGHRALANWPDASVADELLQIAKTSDVETYRLWSLRAYARVVALPSDRPGQEKFAMLQEAMRLATQTEDKEYVISRLAAVRVPDALALLVSLVDDAQMQQAAVPAVFTLAKGLSQSHPVEAAAALEKIRPLTRDPALQQQIPKVLRDIEARKQKPDTK